MKKQFQTSHGNIWAGFVLVILLLVGSAGVSYLNSRELRDDSARVERTHLVLETLGEVLTAVVDAETGQRGYLITGEESYLAPYQDALITIEEHLAQLDRLTADHPLEQQYIPAIKQSVGVKLEELARTIALFQDDGFDAVRAVVKDDSGQDAMLKVRQSVQQMQAIESSLLEERSQQTRKTFRIAVISGLIATLLGVGATILLGRLVRRFGLNRELAAQRLFLERERLEVTLKSIGDAVITTDIDGTITMMNGIAEALTGWSLTEGIGQPLLRVFDIVKETTGEKVENPAVRALAEGRIVGLANHTILIAKDGTRRAISDSAGPIRAADGTILGAVLVFRDVQQARELEKGIEFRNRLLELAVDVGNALAGGTSYSNSLQRCCEALIDHVEGAIARIWNFDPHDQRLHLQANAGSASRRNDPHFVVELGQYKIGRIAATRESYQVNGLEGDPMFPDQAWVKQEQLVSFAGYPLVVGDRLVGVMALYARHPLQERTLEMLGAVAQEIAVGIDRQRAVVEDRENRHLLEVTLESIGDAVLTTDAEGKIAFLNRTAEQLTGWSGSDAIGRRAEEVVSISSGNGHTVAEHPILTILASETRVELQDCSMVRSTDEKSIPLEVTGAPILVENLVVGAVLVFRDMSERLRNLREREQLLEQAENERLLLEAVMDALPAGVVIADANGRLTHINDALKKIWGSSTPMSQGIEEYANWKGWWPETGQRIQAHEWAMARALTTGEVCPGEEIVIERFDGGKATIINSASPIRDASGKIVGGVVAELDVTELTETRLALRDARSRLNSLLEAGELGTWEWDIESDLIYSDQNLESMFDVLQSPSNGIPLSKYLETVHIDDQPRVHAAIRAAVEKSERLEVDYRVKDASGAIHWLVARGRVEEDARGKPSRVAGMVIDVTDRRNAEIALAESRQFLEESLDALPSHIAVLDSEGTILIVNRAWREFALANGYQGADFGVGSNYLDMCEASGHSELCEDGTAAAEGIRRVLENEVPHFDLEYACHAPDKQRWFLMRVNRFDSSLGLRVIVSHEDISSRVVAEMNVRDSEEKFRTLADNISQFAWMTDPNGWIFWYNKRWFDYTGTTLKEMQGWGWMKVHHPDYVDRVVEKFKRCLETGEPWEDTFPLRSKDGEYRWFLSRANPIYDERGNIVRWFGTNTDITKHLELEKALLDADQRKDQFLATLGHELRNPLAGILGGVEVLESAAANRDEQLEAQEIIARQSRFMERLIDDLLDVSRIVRNKVTIKKEIVDVKELVEEVVNDSQCVFHEQHIDLTTQFTDDAVFCLGDRERLRQVFTNLIYNAQKFTDPGGRVHIQLMTHDDAQQFRFVVTDSGIGMTEATLGNIFQPFVQADTSLDRSRGGLGLGLAIVRGLIELHGGSVSAASDGLGKGSTFAISLPTLRQDPKMTESSSGQTKEDSHCGRLTVLVVDDRRDASFALVKFLQRAGHIVHTAEDGPSAVETATRLGPQVVVCDIGLPGFDGYEVARRLRSNDSFAETLLIAVTGYGQPQDRSATEAAGFDCHIVKPVDRKHLLQTIANWAMATGKTA